MSPVAGLALATAFFVGTHFLLSHPLRAPLVARLGERAFLGLYSLVALIGLAAMILAWRQTSDTYPFWIAPAWWWWGGSFVILFATILLVGSLFGNPALPHPGAEPRAIPPPRGVFAITRHPMNWAFILWALVHISLWGTPRNLIVAGGLLLLALFGSIGQDQRKARRLGQEWRRCQARTGFIPFAGQLAGRIPWRAARPGWIAGLGGFILWLLVTWWHAPDVSPIAYYFDFRHAF